MQMNSLALPPHPQGHAPRTKHTAHHLTLFIAFAVAAAVWHPCCSAANELSHLNTLKALQNLKYI